MSYFRFLKGAAQKMIRTLTSKYTTKANDSVLGRRKYVLHEISRSQIKLPANQSVLSMTKYFLDEDSDTGNYDDKDKKMDW